MPSITLPSWGSNAEESAPFRTSEERRENLKCLGVLKTPTLTLLAAQVYNLK
jgi:hypothetical protein